MHLRSIYKRGRRGNTTNLRGGRINHSEFSPPRKPIGTPPMKYNPEKFEHQVEAMLDEHNENFQKLIKELAKLENRIQSLELLHEKLKNFMLIKDL